MNEREQKGGRRALVQQNGVDLTSNDYLGLARSTRLDASVVSAPMGVGGSCPLRGNYPELESLEAEAAAFF